MTSDLRPLLDRCRGGDRAAIGNLLEGYTHYLSLLARVHIGRWLRGKVDAGDVVQETCLEATRQMGAFRGTSEGELLAWLRRILAGQIALTVRRYLGSKGRDATLERDLAVQLDQSSQIMDGGLMTTYSTPSQHAARREQLLLLADALAKLKPDYREVIILRHFESLGFAEVAQRLNRSEDSVQKLWVRALAELRQHLGGAE